MPIDVALVKNGEGLLFICFGALTGRDFLEAKRRLLQFPKRLEKCAYGIIDQFAATSIEIAPTELQEIVELDVRIASIMRLGAIIALVAPQDENYGISRMWQDAVEATAWETMLFRSREEGEAWLRLRVKEKFGLDWA